RWPRADTGGDGCRLHRARPGGAQDKTRTAAHALPLVAKCARGERLRVGREDPELRPHRPRSLPMCVPQGSRRRDDRSRSRSPVAGLRLTPQPPTELAPRRERPLSPPLEGYFLILRDPRDQIAFLGIV